MGTVSKLRVVQPPEPQPKHYAIRTGLRLKSEKTGRSAVLCVCSREQNGGAFFVEERPGRRRRVSADCSAAFSTGTSPKHELISLTDALNWGMLEMGRDEGTLALSHHELLATWLQLNEVAELG